MLGQILKVNFEPIPIDPLCWNSAYWCKSSDNVIFWCPWGSSNDQEGGGESRQWLSHYFTRVGFEVVGCNEGVQFTRKYNPVILLMW